MPIEVAFPYKVGTGYAPDYCRTPEEMGDWLDLHLLKSKVVFTKGNIKLRLHKKSNSTNVLFVTLDGKNLDYVMELKKLSSSVNPIKVLPDCLSNRLCYQASVWRSIELQAEDLDFVKTVFWKYLVSSTRTVISDSAQSDAGENFWSNRIAEALKNSQFRVYGLWCDAKNNSVEIHGALEIETISQMRQFYTSDENANGWYMRLAIAKS